MKIKSYSVERISPHKSHAIWVVREPNIMQPIAYLRKPKHISEAVWARVLKAIKLEATADLLD